MAQPWSKRTAIYAVVPIAVGAASNRASAADAIGAGTQVVALRYAAAKDLAKTLEPFVAEGGKISADPGRNALLVRGDAAVRRTLVSLIRAFDIDLLAGQSYALFPAGDSDPAKLAGELERVLQAQGEGALSQVSFACCRWHGSMQFSWSPHSRVISMRPNALSASCIGPRMRPRAPGMFTMCRTVRARISSFCSSAPFTPRNVSPTGAPPGTTAPGAEQLTIGGGAVREAARRVSAAKAPRQVSAEPAGSRYDNRHGRRTGAERQAAWARLSRRPRPRPRPHCLPPNHYRPRPVRRAGEPHPDHR